MLSLRSNVRSFTRAFGNLNILVVADHSNAVIAPSTLNAVNAANQLGGPVSVLVAGNNCGDAAQMASKISGVSNVLVAQDPAYEGMIAENITNAVLAAQEAGNYTHIIAPASNTGKNVIPRVAVKLDVAAISDISGIVDEETFIRPTYAGNANTTVRSKDTVKVVTVRPTAFEKADLGEEQAAIADAPAAEKADSGLSKFVKDEIEISDKPDLATAKVVIAAGRGIKDAEGMKLCEDLADKLDGAIGATRACVDAGLCPNDVQIGQTGKVIAPELYIGLGISGAIQHVAGIKDSKVIVSINKDPEAPVYQVSDIGLAEDLFAVVPELIEKL
eukprot:TRINITY_DN775875_c0_g1_i1.p1 TRINITY_DN775875_c0_g1~~TRINITY_DN775875_c0_g1_i1.p1  ORF type:complete len:331 (+),score=139.89 TRINITY_DN775875_c0_g1_i1:123-1115(+)